MEGRRKNEILEKLYYDIKLPSGLAGERRLYLAARELDSSINVGDVKKFLSSQISHTIHKVTNKKFVRRKILAPKPKVIISSDLADVRSLSRYNGGYNYIAVFIDVFSRFLKVVPLKKKNAVSLLPAVKKVMESDEFRGG